MNLTERQLRNFWKKVNKRGPDDCWLWQASTNGAGYGDIRIGGKVLLAHRLSWSLANQRTTCLMVLHSCDNKTCVNPNHLCEGTHLENMEDRTARGRTHRKLTPAVVRAIRQDTGTHREIAKKHGTSHRTVGQIKRRETWKHL